MGFFEEQFSSKYLFDNSKKQRDDIEALREGADYDVAQLRSQNIDLSNQIAQMRLVVNTVVSMLETKNVMTRSELEIMMQQVDLLDGIEDGKASRSAWANAPRCTLCNHYVNPEREVCIYCHSPLKRQASSPYRGAQGAPAAVSEVPSKMVSCKGCGNEVPQTEMFFTSDGALRCRQCAL